MINQISIQNYALIQALKIDLKKGLNIFTGETGAGKSIMLDAISLALGNRINHSSIINKDKKCIVELDFDIANFNLKTFFNHHDLDYEDNTILRREVLPNGRSRAFVNDTPVDLKTLKELGFYLIDIHSQHQNILLSDKGFQLSLVDYYSNNIEKLEAYTLKYKAFKKLEKSILELSNSQEKHKNEQDYWVFLSKELENANILDNEEIELAEDLKRMENASSIQEWASFTQNILDESDTSVVQQIAAIKEKMMPFADMNETFKNLYAQLEECFWNLKDIATEAGRHTESVLSDDNKSIDELNERQYFLQGLFKKHNVYSTKDLLIKKEEIGIQLDAIVNSDEDMAILQKQKNQAIKELLMLAKVLTKTRESCLINLSNKIKKQLVELEMENANFEIRRTEIPMNENGIDNVEFYFSSNKGIDLNLLSKSASGGELSRVMFCLKAILANNKALPVMILDEIDTGTSGEAAKKMADMMHAMSKNMQMIVITHLPQIAAKGEHHYYIYKNLIGNKTETKVKQLTDNERINELATLIEGKNPSETALTHATTLLHAQ